MIIVILGPSGCGKGTQARLLAEKFGLAHISTGSLLRQEYEKGTELGLAANEWLNKGLWVPTEIVEPILLKNLGDHPQGNFVIEGWPRLSEQKEILDKFLVSHGLKIDRVFYLETPMEVSRQRVGGRVKEALAKGQKPRSDEDPETVEARLKSFHETIGPILDYYRQKGLLEVINNQPSVAEVSKEIIRRLHD